MVDYNPKPNSHRAKEAQQAQQTTTPAPEKRVEKVVKGTAKTKKNNVRKLTDIFIAEDANNVKSYVLMDVIVPAIKNALYDVVVDGIGMFLGKPIRGGGARAASGGTAERTSYRSYYDQRNEREYGRARAGSRFDYDDVVFETRGDAVLVLDQLHQELAKYGIVRVSDLYDMAGITAPYTYNNYGWNSLRGAEVIRVRDGYIIKTPNPMAID